MAWLLRAFFFAFVLFCCFFQNNGFCNQGSTNELLMNNGNDPLTSILLYKRKFAWPNRDFIVQLKAGYPIQACAAGVK